MLFLDDLTWILSHTERYSTTRANTRLETMCYIITLSSKGTITSCKSKSSVSVENFVSIGTVFCRSNILTETPYFFGKVQQ